MALKGIVIDPGHGGKDPGATGNGIIEKDLNLLISKYMYNRFKELGVPVTLTRNSDETLDQKARVNRVLNAYGNTPDVIVISNHINAGGGDGAEVIYALRNNSTLSKTVLDEIEKEGQNVRKYYQQRLPSNPIKDYYFMHRDTPNAETIIVEYGFLDSNKDDVSELKNNYERYAEAVVRAVTNYKNIPYTSPIESDYYIVQKGDSLWKIATKYNLTVDELKSINNLSSNIINVGQSLKVIPNEVQTESSDYLTYTVKKGDTLYSIAKKYNKSVNEIKEKNNLVSDDLKINQKLFIPTSENDVGEVEAIKYVVQKGDNLYAIGNKYGVSANDIMTFNNLINNTLQIGQVLLIPGTDSYMNYNVKKGDSLWKIANTYGTTVNKIKQINNLTSNDLQIGQKLLIPSK